MIADPSRETLPPIVREVRVAWDPATAFAKFTRDFAAWWPSATHSVGGDRVERIVFEPRMGGLIFEQHVDGRRFQWGRVCGWDPPRSVRFSWHPSRDESTAQDVLVEFLPADEGTTVRLTSDGWERFDADPRQARRGRKGYDMGWGYILNLWAGKRTLGMRMLDGLVVILTALQKLRGGRAATIAKARGELTS